MVQKKDGQTQTRQKFEEFAESRGSFLKIEAGDVHYLACAVSVTVTRQETDLK
jgi:hypothetical protein